MAQKNILITISSFPDIGGARSVVHDMWAVLIKKYDVHFLTRPPKDFKKYPYKIHKLTKLYASPSIVPFNIVYILIGIFKLILLNNKYKYKVIISQDGVFTGLYSIIAGKITNTKVVLMDYGSVANYWSDDFWNTPTRMNDEFHKISSLLAEIHTMLLRRMAFIAIKISAKYADKIMISGKELNEIYTQYLNIKKTKIEYYNYSVDVEKFCPLLLSEKRNVLKKEMGFRNNDIILTIAGRLAAEKGFEYCLPAFKKVCKENTNIRVLICGEGTLKSYIESFIQKNSLRNHLILMGDVSRDELPKILQITDIFLYTGTMGGVISIGVLEAMSTGCNIIATNSPKIHEELLGEGRGICIPTRNEKAIYDAINEAIKNVEVAPKINYLARNFVEKNYSMFSLAKHLENIINRD